MRKILFLITVISTLIFGACNHKELCYHHPHQIKIKVEFNWQNAPDANPMGMCVFFYSKNDNYSRRVDFIGMQGGYVELAEGEYQIIAYNNDTESVLFAGTGKFGSHYAYTREGSVLEPAIGSTASHAPRAQGAEEERVRITPDKLWGCFLSDVKISSAGVEYSCIHNNTIVENKEQIITLYPNDLVCHYSYEILNVSNLGHATLMCASLSGMAGKLSLSTLALDKECITLPLEANMNRADSTITGEFLTFGHSLENDTPHNMLLYVWMDNGDKFYFGSDDPKFNVTEQIHNAPNPKRVHLIIDGLKLPKPLQNGEGYKPTIDDWEEEFEDVIM